MPERIRFITERDRQILLVDLSSCPPSEVADVARTVPSHVMARPRGSVLLLVNFVGASFDPEAIRTLKETAVFDKPFVRKAAWIGASVLLDEVSAEITNFSRREVPIFSSQQQAVSWLLED